MFGEIAENVNSNISRLFLLAKHNMEKMSAGEAFEEAVDNFTCNLNLEDKKVIKMLSKLLGRTDVEGANKSNRSNRRVFRKSNKRSRRKKKKKNERL